MKTIVYKNPIDYMRGNLSGRQDLEYGTNDGKAYDQQTGQKTAANNYQPRLIAKVLRAPFASRRRYFQVRTRTSVNMTDAMRKNMAVMGGAGALYGAIVRDGGEIYEGSVEQWKKYHEHGPLQIMTFRAFLFSSIHDMLASGSDTGGVGDLDDWLENPWKLGNDDVNTPVPQALFDKFNEILSNL